MADVSGKINDTLKLIKNGDYFIINLPRQYGKTTTLNTLSQILMQSDDYMAIRISFEGIGDAIFVNEESFSKLFIDLWAERSVFFAPTLTEWLKKAQDRVKGLDTLSKVITELANEIDRKLVILIDEVDKSSNNQLFVSFLAMLRDNIWIGLKLKPFILLFYRVSMTSNL